MGRCDRCHKRRYIHHTAPRLCGSCYSTWVQWGRPDQLPMVGVRKPREDLVEGLAAFLVAFKDPLAIGKLGGLDAEYVAGRIGCSVRTVNRYRRMIRDDHPAVAWARLI